MRPARESDIPVRVKNSYNPEAPGTLINKTRDMSKVCSSTILITRTINVCKNSNTAELFISK